ncbi:MAG: hypothetical protein ACFCAD_16520 [Pleurocapsa sp.]
MGSNTKSDSSKLLIWFDWGTRGHEAMLRPESSILGTSKMFD